MRITFVTSKINFETAGGSVPDLDRKVRDMRELGADVQVITLFSELDKFSQLPYRVIQEHTPLKRLDRIQARVFRVMRAYEKDTDVFHVEGKFAYGAALYRLLGGKPVVVFYNREPLVVGHTRGFRTLVRTGIEKNLCRTLVPQLDHFIFTCPQLEALHYEFGLHVHKKSTIMLDFFDAEAIRAHAHKAHHPRTSDIRLFASGRLIKDKGFDLLLEAIGHLDAAVQSRISLTISGDGPERKSLVAHASQLRGLKDVSFPGWVTKDQLLDLLSQADIFVMPRSWHLDLPSVIVMEALALSVPTIAPGGGGVEWMAGGSIATFTDNDVASLSAALGRLIGSEVERARLREAAAERVRGIDHLASRPKLFSIFKSLAA